MAGSPTPRARRQADGDQERQPLVAAQRDHHSGRYDAIDQQPQPAHRATLPKSPYLSFSLRLGFLAGFVLLLLSTILLLLLLVNVFVPLPLLLPPHRSPAVLPIWFCVTSILIVAPGLLVFELASRATRALHFGVLLLNVTSLVVVCAVQELRTTYAWLGIAALSLSLLSVLWALLTSHILAAIQIPYTIQPEGGFPIVAHISAQQVQGRWSRAFKVIFAVIGTAIVASTMVLLTFNISLDAADAGFRPLGNLTRVSLTSSHVRPSPTDPPTKDPLPVSFRLHLACQSAEDLGGGVGLGALANDVLKKPTNDTLGRPTALVMTERGVAGVVGAGWVREMVARSTLPSASKKKGKGGDGDGDGDDNDDGHLSLSQVCFWDRIGHGHTDFVNRPFSIPVHTEALHQALVAAGRVDEPRSSSSPSPSPSPSLPLPPFNDELDAAQGGKKNSTALGPFMLVATGFGSLFAQDFAATYPHLVHSMLLIDAETPASWYTDAVPLSSGLRAGFAAPYHGYFGSLYSDLLPMLVEPLGVTRLIGLLRGRTVADRILAPGYHGGAHRSDPAGGGWRIRGAGGANSRLLTASWYERLDANMGPSSTNFHHLNQSSHAEAWNKTLATKPVAVLSSFWKIHRDVDGWGAIQRGLVGTAKAGGNLVGWWRVGEREGKRPGGDQGAAEGLCATQLGRVFCQEAVRKLLAAGDLAAGAAS
ncbi:uncharacterized protein PFL1_02131 [Pseudozyma flocculosa PF-1]|uniref:Uncharacterized protein n=1 Tax=Pseudozyma flocculosa TaxID=84751 RepID=A0A5C3F346_9BASI|nr:uncharacterized protein PFL1_02131 [Pseudozyma flocculosa PF-1]EPQ30607.1 hypothetical protein PFL1_02131 [Pseudozyma flocculosa PF-1]SPO37701.1 uncharacterized protein PSFLO_03177 [Pseudozyma flocculosa]